MSLKTRLDGRSKDNSSFVIKDKEGVVLVSIKLDSKNSAAIEIDTMGGLHVEKPNGWSSNSQTNN